jgi:hypothetical protein
VREVVVGSVPIGRMLQVSWMEFPCCRRRHRETARLERWISSLKNPSHAFADSLNWTGLKQFNTMFHYIDHPAGRRGVFSLSFYS